MDIGVHAEVYSRNLISHLLFVSTFFSLVLLGDNLEYFQSNLSMHGMDTRNKALLYKTVTNRRRFQKGVFYAGIKMSNSLKKR
jgi:hypothetical protein